MGDRVGAWLLGRALGEGQFGKVRLATHEQTHAQAAVKIINKGRLDKLTSTMVRRESTISRLLHHPNIVEVYEVIETDREIFIVMECCTGGEIFEFLIAHGRLQEKDARKVFRQLVSALEYCHKLRVIHRDLKLENLLLGEQLQVKVTDFGFSNVFAPHKLMETYCGSPHYAAPEIVSGTPYGGPEVDMWSLGVIIFTLVAGRLPFDSQETPVLYRKIKSGDYEMPAFFSPEFADLIRSMLCVNGGQRATIETVRQHNWTNLSSEPLAPPEFTIDDRSMPDTEVLDKMGEMGYDRLKVIQSVTQGLDDDASARYSVLLKEKRRSNSIENLIKPAGSATPHAPNGTLGDPPAKGLQRAAHLKHNRRHSTGQRGDVAATTMSPPLHASPLPPTSGTPTKEAAPSAGTPKEHKPFSRPPLSPIAGSPMPGPVTETSTASTLTAGSGGASTVTEPSSPSAALPPLSITPIAAPGRTHSAGVPEHPPLSTSPTTTATGGLKTLDPLNTSAGSKALGAAVKRGHRRTRSDGAALEGRASSTSPTPTKGLRESAGAPVTQLMPPRPPTAGSGRNSPKPPVAPIAAPLPAPHINILESTADRSTVDGLEISNSESRPLATVPEGSNPASPLGTSPTGSSAFGGHAPTRRTPGVHKNPDGSVYFIAPPHMPVSVRFAFSLNMTSTKPPSTVAMAVCQTLTQKGISYTVNGWVINCSQEPVNFTIEICSIRGLNVMGVRVKRDSGPGWAYKNICADIIAGLNL